MIEMVRSLLTLKDIEPEEFTEMVNRAVYYKSMIGNKKMVVPVLKGKYAGLLFEKPSTRTRTSFEVASERMGGHALYLSSDQLHLSGGEPVKDVARMLGGWLDIMVARVFAQSTLEELKKYSGIPVINALSDSEHPTQMVSDFLTIMEKKKKFKGLKMTFVGDGTNNMANSLMLACSMTGIDLTIATPDAYQPDASYKAFAEKLGKKAGSAITVTDNVHDSAIGADILYTDVWVSMGEEAERQKRLEDFKGFQINSGLLKLARPDAIVMHCLPAERGLEITDEVIEGKQSVAWQQGVNKIYGAASSIEWAMGY
ncbi:ornithine carbamoyltransferase [Ferroplasma acidarmanus Fer1]|uniref:Ornithine carbamoyltransferase n=2 Tax=Ferroplasma TaxID=74968 RepID=S0ANR9_FERAC|nr:ornithine carbamoyltransferase [Ferroplasma acidarmanus Fer1]